MEHLWDSYDKLNSLVYIIDAETYEIVYMNRKTLDLYHLKSIADAKKMRCYELFRCNAEPCPECLVTRSTKDTILEREVYNFRANSLKKFKDVQFETNGKHYFVHISDVKEDYSAKYSGINREALVRECMRISLEEPDNDRAIRWVLDLILQAFFAERSYIIEDNGRGGTDNTYEWCAYGVEPQINNLQNVPYEETRIWFELLERDGGISIRDLEDLKGTDTNTYNLLQAQQIKSIFVIPLMKQGVMTGFLGVDNPAPERMDDVEEVLKSLRYVIENMLVHRSFMRQLEVAGMYDPMTKLGNRYAFNTQIKSLDIKRSLGVIYCDVCGLKHTNDTLGHREGDKLILRAVECLREVFGDYFLYRLGGDEMAAIVPGVDRDELRELCDKLRGLSVQRKATLAIGWAWSAPGEHNMGELLNEADTYMYEDKKLYYAQHNLETTELSDIRKEQFGWTENNTVPMYVLSAKEPYNILYANALFLELLGYKDWEEYAASDVSNSIRDMIPEEDMVQIKYTVHEMMEAADEKNGRMSFRIRTKAGKFLVLEVYVSRTMHPAYGPLHVNAVIDVDTFFKNYIIDSNTGLPGTNLFQHKLDQTLKEWREQPQAALKIIYLNVENFRSYNLRYGTVQGDVMLRRIALLLQLNFPGDYIARLTADHFAVQTFCEDEIKRLKDVEEIFRLNFSAFGCGLKAGIYHVIGSDTALTALDSAEATCDSLNGKPERIRVYDAGIRGKLELQNYILKNFESAMQNHEIYSVGQPIVRSINRHVCSVEALARWQSPEYGMISPGVFIPILEEKHLVYKLDLFILREVLATMSKNLRQPELYELILPVSINLSRYDFFDCDIFEEVEALMQEYNVPHEMIKIEVTESSVISDSDTMKNILLQFRNAGYKIWMDDFGSGYSSLNVLRDYPFDGIKLDMTFLRNFDERSKALITFSVQLAKSLGLQTVAEGVETEEQMEFLISIGCERLQGYLLGKPCMPEDGLHERLESRNVIPHELRYWNDYYNKVSAVRFDTDKAMALVEWDGDYVHYLHFNEQYNEVRRSLSNLSVEEATADFNAPGSLYYSMGERFKKVVLGGKPVENVEYTLHGYLIRVSARIVAQKDERMLIFMELDRLVKVQDA